MRSDNVNHFALKVERLCDFLIDKYCSEYSRDGGPDLKVLEDLKEDAADIHTGAHNGTVLIEGLAEAMNGLSPPA